MTDTKKLEEAFRQLFKVFDRLRASGAKKMGRTNLATLVALTYRQGRALFFIAEGERSTADGIHQVDLARALNTTVPATSILVDTLVKKNLVRRFQSPNDRRSFCLRLTPRGKKVHDLAQKGIRDLAAELTDGLSEADKEAFVRVVAHFHQRLSGSEQKSPPF